VSALISPDASRAFYERRGLVLGEQPDGSRCGHCDTPTDPDFLLDLDGVPVCRPCALALTGDDPHGPDSWRDL
jgi:hypothetical protein